MHWQDKKIILAGGAGLVGQNLVAQLRARGYRNLVVLDKHRANLAVLRQWQPQVQAEYADLAQAGEWQRHVEGAAALVMLQAQIGGTLEAEFTRNNITSTRLILALLKHYPNVQLIHISSSVLNSAADDFYTRSKRAQEQLVRASGLACTILRPTLMFGWFDRKHLGWLARFMRRVPLFPIPGHGRYLRQPLYAADFCRIIVRCLEKPELSGTYNISGQENIDYIDIIRRIRQVTGSRTLLCRLPYRVFHALLRLWACFDRNPPFTTQQLAALCTRDCFEVIDWPSLFGVPATPFAVAIDETFNDRRYSHIILEF